MKTFPLLWSAVLLSLACAPPSMTSSTQNNVQTPIHRATSVPQTIQPAPTIEPSTNPIVIKIDTGMNNESNPNRRVLIMNERSTKSGPVKTPDKNSFDPADPSSLGDLKATDGDALWGSGLQVSRFMFIEPDRNKFSIPFETGVLTVEFQNPAVGLVTFQELYGGKVRNKLEIGDSQFHDIVLDLERGPVKQIEALVQKFNMKHKRAIREVSLSSWAAFRTFVIQLDLLLNHEDMIKSVSVNGIGEPAMAYSRVIPNPQPSASSSSPPTNPTSQTVLPPTLGWHTP